MSPELCRWTQAAGGAAGRANVWLHAASSYQTVCVRAAVPITVELGVYINYIYAISEQTMVSQRDIISADVEKKTFLLISILVAFKRF